MPTASEKRRRFKALLAAGRSLAVPGAHDALSARLIEAAGFEAAYVGSYATAAARFGLPDVGLVTMDEMTAHAATVARAVDIPVLADAENGFGPAANVWRTVRAFEAAGTVGVHIEDHEFGKHADVPQRLMPAEGFVAKIRAALEAREDPDFLIVARSDAAWALGDIDETVRRLAACAAAGADLVFPTMVPPPRLAEIRGRLGAKVMVVDTPGFSSAAESGAGADVVLHYGMTVLAAWHGVREALAAFRAGGDADAAPGLRARAAEFERFMGYEEFAARVRRHGAG